MCTILDNSCIRHHVCMSKYRFLIVSPTFAQLFDGYLARSILLSPTFSHKRKSNIFSFSNNQFKWSHSQCDDYPSDYPKLYHSNIIFNSNSSRFIMMHRPHSNCKLVGLWLRNDWENIYNLLPLALEF